LLLNLKNETNPGLQLLVSINAPDALFLTQNRICPKEEKIFVHNSSHLVVAFSHPIAFFSY